MVCRVHDVLSIFCGDDGTSELCLPSPLNPPVAVHRDVLWLYYDDASVRLEGKCQRSRMNGSLLTNITASQHHSDTHFGNRPTRLPSVVPD